MNVRSPLFVLLLIPLSLVMLVGFEVRPKPVAQSERVNVIELAARVVVLEEENVELEARVSELEHIVNQLLTSVEGEQPTPIPERGSTTGTSEATEIPAEEPTVVPTLEATAEVTVEVTAEADIPLPSIEDFEIDWSGLSEYFEITNIRFELEQTTDSAGQLTEVPVLAFDVEAKSSMVLSVFYANFYDANESQMVFFSFVNFTPDSFGNWLPGMRSRGHIRLPEMSDVVSIRFKKL